MNFYAHKVLADDKIKHWQTACLCLYQSVIGRLKQLSASCHQKNGNKLLFSEIVLYFPMLDGSAMLMEWLIWSRQVESNFALPSHHKALSTFSTLAPLCVTGFLSIDLLNQGEIADASAFSSVCEKASLLCTVQYYQRWRKQRLHHSTTNLSESSLM